MTNQGHWKNPRFFATASDCLTTLPFWPQLNGVPLGTRQVRVDDFRIKRSNSGGAMKVSEFPKLGDPWGPPKPWIAIYYATTRIV